MDDTERERINAICEVAGVAEIDDLSDGFHTFRQLYYQRMVLFATIVKQNRDKAWKSLRHEDGELCFGGGWFIVGIDTPEGSYTYHYEDNYYSLFDCEELERSKHWDGHAEKDVTRLLSLPKAQLSQEGTTSDQISRQAAIDCVTYDVEHTIECLKALPSNHVKKYVIEKEGYSSIFVNLTEREARVIKKFLDWACLDDNFCVESVEDYDADEWGKE